MRISQNQKVGSAIALLMLGVSALIFQNCTQATPSSGTDILTSQADAAPFAYDSNIDQVAYMSCNNVANDYANGTAFFTMRAGAYRTAGLRFNDDFLTYIKNKPFQRQEDIVTYSPVNTQTIMQIAIRPKGALQSVVAVTSPPTMGHDYSNFLETLGTPDLTDQLLALGTGARISRLRNGTVTGDRMEGDLVFNSSYAVESSVRNAFQTDVLALTYTNATGTAAVSAVSARAPGNLNNTASPSPSPTSGQTPYAGATPDPNQYVYGKGLAISFSTPAVSGLNNQFPPVVMSSVTEANLVNPTDSTNIGQWSCPQTMQFRIVRAQDIAVSGANCVMGPDPSPMSAGLQIVRNSLRSEDWYVDMADRCIIPKVHGSGCYGTYQTVIYNMSDSCSTTADSTCVAYASICYRIN